MTKAFLLDCEVCVEAWTFESDATVAAVHLFSRLAMLFSSDVVLCLSGDLLYPNNYLEGDLVVHDTYI